MNYLDEQAKDHPDHKYKYNFDSIIRKCLMERVKYSLPKSPEAVFMELGSYDGYSTQIIKDCIGDRKLIVVEGSEQMCSQVQSRFENDTSIEVVHSLFEDYHPVVKADYIFMIHTLEHLENPVKELEHIQTWLNPGGRLLIACPNANALSRKIAVRMGLIPSEESVTEAEAAHGHHFTYSLSTLDWVARLSGFRIANRGGVLIKPLANFQFDSAIAAGIIDDEYIKALDKLSKENKLFEDMSATIYVEVF